LSRIWGANVFWVDARRRENDRKVTLFYIKKTEAIIQQKKIQQHATVYQNLLFHIYMKLHMFRATRRPSSGTKNHTSSLWFCTRGRLLDVWLLDADSVQQPHIQQPSMYAKPGADSAVLGS
jgi:hypothetical protein